MEKVFNSRADELTLEDVKHYLRVDYDYDDSLIISLLMSAKSFVQNYLNMKFEEFDELPTEFTICVLSITSHWYENRAVQNEKSGQEVPFTFKQILDYHRKWSVRGDAEDEE